MTNSCKPIDCSLPGMGFSRQKYWSGLPFPSPGNLPDPRSNASLPTLQADSLPTELPEEGGIYILMIIYVIIMVNSCCCLAEANTIL